MPSPNYRLGFVTTVLLAKGFAQTDNASGAQRILHQHDVPAALRVRQIPRTIAVQAWLPSMS
jgi:hypothetical protein